MAGFVRSQWWYPISSCISWAWSEVGTAGGKPWEAAVLRHRAESGNRLPRGAWRPLLVIRATRCSRNPLEIPSWPLIFWEMLLKKKKQWFLFPGRAASHQAHLWSLQLVHTFPCCHRDQEPGKSILCWNHEMGSKIWCMSELGGFFRCVMLFRIWLLIFNSANIPVCWK